MFVRGYIFENIFQVATTNRMRANRVVRARESSVKNIISG